MWLELLNWCDECGFAIGRDLCNKYQCNPSQLGKFTLLSEANRIQNILSRFFNFVLIWTGKCFDNVKNLTGWGNCFLMFSTKVKPCSGLVFFLLTIFLITCYDSNKKKVFKISQSFDLCNHASPAVFK